MENITLIATVKYNSEKLELAAKAMNNGRTDGVYFHVNDSRVSVSNPHYRMTEKDQLDELNWFLIGFEYQITKM